MDGETSVETRTLPGAGCWRKVSTCQAQGFTLAFWFKLISQSGLENHGDVVWPICAKKGWNKEGWGVHLLNWQSTIKLKLTVTDTRFPNINVHKNMDSFTVIEGQWAHYVAIYKFTFSGDNPHNLFKIFKNGEQQDTNAHDKGVGSINPDSVDKLAFGRFIQDNSGPPYPNVMLDELLIFDEGLDNDMIDQLYQNYQQ